ncbi:MAG TPA: hypothetical protein VID47_03935 [Actinomycetota bacterium]
MDLPAVFESLDFLYVPSGDVASDTAYFRDVLGAQPVFSVDGMGARVSALRMTDGPPLVLLTDHLEGDRTIFVYRVTSLRSALDELAARGWRREGTFEIPHGPVCSFTTPGGQRVAVYELTRPEVGRHFEGRFDF